MFKNKYETLVALALATLPMVEAHSGAGFNHQRLISALSALTPTAGSSGLPTSINSYGITADGDNNRIDICPVEQMLEQYIQHIWHGAAKPEWLAHAL